MNRDKVTARELADYFEVSVRTIYRDLETINQAGIPIIAFQGSQGGYGIMDNYKIDKQILNSNEMNSIVVALKGLDKTVDKRDIKNIIEKIKVLIPDLEENKIAKKKKYHIDYTPWGVTSREKEKLDVIEEAIDDNQLISFSYMNLQGIKTKRKVEPMTLVLRGSSWYLYGYCRLREDYRLFKSYRMREVSTLADRFIRREEEFDDSIFYQRDQERSKVVDLVLKFGPEVRGRVEEWFGEEDITIKDDKSILVETSYPEDEWVYGFILSFGDNVEVLKPDYIRDIIKEKAGKILDKYKK